MKKVIALFACEAKKRGKELGWEMRMRLEKLGEALHDPRFDGAEVLIVSEATTFNPPSLYSELVVACFRSRISLAHAITVVPCDSKSTADEIDAFEFWIERDYPSYEVWAASSDYHVDSRILGLWEFRHTRIVNALLLRVPRTLYIRKRMLLEYPKRWLIRTPAWFQGALGQIMSRLKMN